MRLLDCINSPEELIAKAQELGMSGIAITDHECLSAAVRVNKVMKKLHKENSGFKIALGNEIYLTETRNLGQRYYHFILIAKDAIGHRALRELSSYAWFNSYKDRGLERVPTLYSELVDIVRRYPGHLIASTACIGGETSHLLLLEAKCIENEDYEGYAKYHGRLTSFIKLMLNLFGDDFYIELPPGGSKEQIQANRLLYKLAKEYNIHMSVGTDAHYLRPEERPIHKAYLNSKEGEREVDSFYEYAYLMNYDEVTEILSRGLPQEEVEKILDGTQEMYEKITYYDLFHKQSIPSVDISDYPKRQDIFQQLESIYPNYSRLFISEDNYERSWAIQCWDKLNELHHGLNDCGGDKYVAELDEEARVKTIIGQKLETNMFKYPITLQHYIDLIWECGSPVGAGRGSSNAALNHMLLGITQLDPIIYNFPFFRYLNDERTELGDIDIDISPSKRPLILDAIRRERSHMLAGADWAKENLGCTLVATFGTESTKSCIITACKGYKSEDFPNGIDIDEAQYISSLVPIERGFVWPVHDMIYGNPEKGRQPVKVFLDEVNQYPGLLDIIISIEGKINHRGSHASGVIFFENDPFKHCAFMKTSSGDIITQFDLEDDEYLGLTKYDFLVTSVQDKILKTIQLLQQDGKIEPELSLKEVYNKYLHPNVLNFNNEKCWDALDNNEVINIFQFESQVGIQGIQRLQPRNINEMSNVNGLIRLMGDGEERPIDKYYRFKKNINLWYKEMDEYGLTKEEQKILEPYFLPSYGVPISQEQLMRMLMDPGICNFTLGEANYARKVVGKKKLAEIPTLKNKVYTQAASKKLGKYVWKCGIGPQMGYAFSEIHSMSYTIVGFQTLFLATHWNPIYWDTGCLIINSGASDETANESTDYGKTAKALNNIIAAGIKVSLPDINQSDFTFKPDEKNNQILYGLKAMSGVGDELIQKIKENRPYYSIKDFYYKVKPDKTAMVSLIKGGAFDKFTDRRMCMAWYLWETCDKKTQLTLANVPGLINHNLLPSDNSFMELAKRVYNFNRYLKDKCLSSDKKQYILDERAITFLNKIEDIYSITYVTEQNTVVMEVKIWDKVYQKYMDIIRTYLKDNKEQILYQLNSESFKQQWLKYAQGNYSAWEMAALSYYYHEHELARVNKYKYQISLFKQLPEEPRVAKTFTKGGHEIKIFELTKIVGTCIEKNKSKGIITLLTLDGVVTVRFRKEYFSLFDKQISERQPDGTKKIKERSWFNKGNMLLIQGIRINDEFVSKKYASQGGHQLYKIESIDDKGNLSLRTERYKGEAEDEEEFT